MTGQNLVGQSPRVAFILDRSAAVAGVDPVIIIHHRPAVSGLITERPDDDRRVVLVALDHADGSVMVSERPLGPVREGLMLGVSHAMAFDVGLVNQVESILVSEFVPPFLLRIMRGADGIVEARK